MENLPLNSQPSESQPQSEIDLYILNAKAEIALRNRALTLSMVVTVMVLAANIWFTYNGRTFIMPDIVYAIILAPWLGAGTGKLIDIFTRNGRK